MFTLASRILRTYIAQYAGYIRKGVYMKAILLFRRAIWCSFVLLIILPALPVGAQMASGAPPINAPIVREGDFALALQQALGLGSAADETEAETRLGDVGIAPRNGWIADYPVTPDVMGELHAAVVNAADAGRLPMNGEEALLKLNDVGAQAGLSVAPYAGAQTQAPPPSSPEAYPNPTVINNYYYTQGPPVVTYYTPPPDYYYLYTWVPYPFWYTGFWFPGFFVLHDFHRVVVAHGRPVFVSNHFNDIRAHRVFRVDPDRRFHGRTFAGIGAPRARGFVSTGVPRSDVRIFNAPRAVPGSRTFAGPPGGSRGPVPPSGSFRAGAPGSTLAGPPAGSRGPGSGSFRAGAPPGGFHTSGPAVRGVGPGGPSGGSSGGFRGGGGRGGGGGGHGRG